MRSQSGASPGLDLRAVGFGVIWGLILLVLGALLQAAIGMRYPLTEGTQALMTMAWQAVAGLLGGLQSARQAEGSGWLHGAVTGTALILVIAVVMGISSAFPTLAALLKMIGIGAGGGAVGGIVGVNMSRK